MSETKRSVGRPSKYNPELQSLADKYLDVYNVPAKEGGAGDVIPSGAGLCCWLGISRSTMAEWNRYYPEFSATVEAIAVMQEKSCVNGGMAGLFNASITKLVLANHGYSEKREVDNKSSDGTMSPKDDSKAILSAIESKYSNDSK
jgi:hypothetical protein